MLHFKVHKSSIIYHTAVDYMNKENFRFDDQNKQVVFLSFCYVFLLKRNNCKDTFYLCPNQAIN